MTKLVKVTPFEGEDGKGRKVMVAHAINAWGESNGYGVWVQCENYVAGKDVKIWRYVTTGQTKDEAIEKFKKVNRR